MRVVCVDEGNADKFRSGIEALERLSVYPLGDDYFRIDHGADYFAFFRRLGKLRYYAIEQDGRPLAVAAAVLRTVPAGVGASLRRSWYLCDLKVHPDYRGLHLPLKLLGTAFFPNYFRCRRGYAVSMNPADGRPNRMVKLLQRFRWAPFGLAGRLMIYALDLDRMQDCRDLIESFLGRVAFLSLQGKKDLILQSTGKPMPVLHVQHGPSGEAGLPDPAPGYTHMFCLPEAHPLLAALALRNIQPTADASIIAHGMSGADWNFILTSDI